MTASTSTRVTNRDLDERLKKLEECSEENHRALRGTNGEVGLVGRVTNMEFQISRLMTNDLPHLKEEILRELQVFKDLYEKDQKAESERNVQWPHLAQKFLYPVIIAIITAITMAIVIRGTGIVLP